MANTETYLMIIVDLISVLVWFSFPGKILTFKKNRIWLTVLMILLNIIEMHITRNISEINNSPIKTLVYFSQYALYVFLAYKEPFKQKVTAFILFVLSITLAELSAILLASALGLNYSESVNGIPVTFLSGLYCALASYLINLGLSIIYNKIKHKHFTNKMWQFQIIVLSQLIMTTSISYSIFLSDSYGKAVMKDHGFTLLLLISFLISVIGDICLYRILNTNSQNYELKNELEIMQTKNRLELEYYEKLKNNIAETRRMNHDFNNILTVIQKTINSSDSNETKEIALKTVEELKDILAKNKIRNYCENELANLIIISKSEDIINEGIDFSANLNIPRNINIKNSDLCRVLTNLLDNAKEACMMSKNKEKSFIVLSSQVKDDYIYITSENYYNTPVDKKNDRFISSKENHKGLGIEIIKEIAKSYSGNFVCDYSDSVFTAIVSLKNI